MAYTTINKSTDYFNTKLWTGNDSAQSITGVGFQPDWTWIKCRSHGGNASFEHILTDAVRGVNKTLFSNSNSSEVTNNSVGYLSAFGSDGFTVTGQDATSGNGRTYVGWNWKANGTGSANTDGTISSTVSANTTSGFSIVKWTPTNTNTPQTIGHGLGVAPSMIIVKNIQRAVDWKVYHKSIGNTHALTLNSSGGKQDDNGYWEDTTPTSTVFTTGNGSGYTVGGVTENFIAYCFRDVVGYSKFGSYIGNGSASSGTFIYTGFKPAFVMVKYELAGNNWQLHDIKRTQYAQPINHRIAPNVNLAEQTGDTLGFDFVSNGFRPNNSNGDYNGNGSKYIYMAFAEAPLVGTNGVTAKAR